ncbi:DUF1214 domain-containing protein [Roseibium sp. RKSG952]|uniref:DUF1214 domain-containing protein n=1 Tax=Roseibium sp. RKSG952 TaxID=2529384 RepID=UPI0012BB4A05|nr:DUF1214 domain-containing protein [Roseibium sp. RKSG952]MTH95574.1 DUF1214 domain-containing protein [Roseibium sp. RKSG952]
MTALSNRNPEADFEADILPPILRRPQASPLRTLAVLMLIALAGIVAGIGSAYLAIARERPLHSVSIGPWQAYPLAGTAQADPYSVAIYSRGAIIPLANGEGLALTARTDSSGRTLDPACQYRIAGDTPRARLWTLTATDSHGKLVPARAGRTHLSSRGLLRRPNGDFVITAARSAQPSNWLPLAASPRDTDGLQFTFRLYDAPVTTGAALEGVTMPAIQRLGCL